MIKIQPIGAKYRYSPTNESGEDWLTDWLVVVVAKFPRPCPIVTSSPCVSPRLGSLDREGWGVSVLSHSSDWLEITTPTLPQHCYRYHTHHTNTNLHSLSNMYLWYRNKIILSTKGKWLFIYSQNLNKHLKVPIVLNTLDLIIYLSLHFHKEPLSPHNQGWYWEF